MSFGLADTTLSERTAGMFQGYMTPSRSKCPHTRVSGLKGFSPPKAQAFMYSEARGAACPIGSLSRTREFGFRG